MEDRKPIKSFKDLIVYQNLYKAMVLVLTKVIPKLPKEEKFDLVNQMQRACKSAPAQIAEGYAKKHHKKSWQKYIDDAIVECNEMIHHLSCCKDVYYNFIDMKLCEQLIDTYNITGKQLYNLGKNWVNRSS